MEQAAHLAQDEEPYQRRVKDWNQQRREAPHGERRPERDLPEIARADLPRIAARHGRQQLDIRPGLFDLWTSCLMSAVRQHDPDFDDDVERAWRETLAFGVRYMRDYSG